MHISLVLKELKLAAVHKTHNNLNLKQLNNAYGMWMRMS